MTEISMTTFVDFVIASGTSRLTVVKNAKAQYEREYNPATDFYKSLRESIIDAAQQNLNGKETLDLIRLALANLSSSKSKAYQECGEGYEKWRGRKNIVWDNAYRSESSEWTQGRLAIRINPELGLLIKGRPHIIKLYFKAGNPSKQRLEAMFHLLKRYVYRKRTSVTVGILDMRRGQLYTPTRTVSGMEQLLAGEAAAFQTMWDGV